MTTSKLSYETAKEAADVWKSTNYSVSHASQLLGIPLQTLRSRLEVAVRYKIIETTNGDKFRKNNEPTHTPRINITLKNGIVLIGSDAHYWPGVVSAAHKAFVQMAKKLKPDVVILNGDVFDGSMASRHAPIGWENRPSISEEVDECRARLEDIELAAPKARRIWNLGNHDSRYETKLAAVAPEYARVHGIHLKDHFPKWDTAWSTWINNDVVVKHRIKGGVHATHNNTVTAGKTTVTGHLHSLKVCAYSDYNGIRWGVDSGSLAPIYPQSQKVTSPQFLNYTEDSPLNWRSGFVILTFKNGSMLWPETVYIRNEKEYEFRGEVFKV